MSLGSNPPESLTHPKLGVAVPLSNEETTISDFLERVLQHLRSDDRVYCVLDHVSKDETRRIVAEFAAADPRAVLVWAPENRCVRDAYFRGYRAAFDDGCEWILEMDGGFSHLPEEIPLFLAAMSQGYEYVGGSRFMAGGRHDSPWTRVVVSKGGTILTKIALNTRMSDMTSGFECFSRKAMSHVLEQGVTSKANFFQSEIRYMMHQYRWLEVPITYQNHNYQIGRSSLREALSVLWALRQKGRNRT
jgi:dolichol-phosphate mannosyltransferase